MVLATTPSLADIVNFPKGSLIIPEQANFQTPCGSLGTYGLVYRLLLANAPGGYFDPVAHPGRTPITVYWIVGGNKVSPNRCVPTNKSIPPNGSLWNAVGSPGYNDGCDFAVSNALQQPVTQVDYSLNPWTSGTMDGIFPIVDLPMRTPSLVGKDSDRLPSASRFIQLSFTSTVAGTLFDSASMALTGTAVASGATIKLSGTGGGNRRDVNILDSTGNQIGTVKSNSSGVWSLTVLAQDANTRVPNTAGTTVAGKQIWFSVLGPSVNYTGINAPEAIPAYTKIATLNQFNGFSDIQYMGGPFVIHQSDSRQVIEFLLNGDGARTLIPVGAFGPVPARTVDVLAEFIGGRASNSALSARPGGFFDACTGPKLTINGLFSSGSSAGTSHYVSMHQALTAFNANVSRRLGNAPPKIALLNRQSNLDSTGGASVSGLAILDAYLGNAGLFLTNSTSNVDSGGCPPNTREACTANGSGATKNGGFIYDNIDANGDLVPQAGLLNGVLGTKDAFGVNTYGVMWSPHWETTHNALDEYPYQSPSGLTGAAAMNNIASFLNLPGKGLMGECASIGSYEGTNSIANYGGAATQFQFNGQVTNNGLSVDNGRWDGMNCTDPNYPNNLTAACAKLGIAPALCFSNTTAAKQECMVWDNTISEFAQIGDYHFVQAGGAIDSFKPKVGVTANSSTRILATTWMNYTPGAYPAGGACDPNDPTCDNHWNIFTLGSKDNDATKGTIVYVAGHDYQVSTVGSRIIMNTLLNLGQQPLYANRAVSSPTIFADPNGARDSVGTIKTGLVPLAFSGVYNLVSGVSNSRFTYSWSVGSQWIFPKTTGNIFERPLVDVGAVAKFAVGSTNFNISALWDANGQLGAVYGGAAGTRNLFTYLGGTIVANAAYPHGALQKNWVPAPVEPNEVDQMGCVDVLSWGKVTDGKHLPYFGLVTGAGDGVCDVFEATQLILPAPCTDGFGVNCLAANMTLLNSTASRDTVKGMLQVVQGACFTTSTRADNSGNYAVPATTAACNSNFFPVNKPLLGGVLHSSPAIVGASVNVIDNGAPRPTVLYTTSADGQLHAFYVSGGAGYTGPSGTLSFPNTLASTVFNTTWANPFVMPLPLTELWAYMPASQLPLLSSNSQMVDSAPVVQDVFADFNNSGIRQWHTVLVATAGNPLGNPGSEVFAMDITNPLKPALLWDMMGTWTGPVGTVTPIAVANLPAATYPGALRSVQTGRGGSYPAAGLSTGSVYGYSTLGATYGLSLGVTRSGVEPSFPVFLSSNFVQDLANAPLTNGAQIFSIDTATGQILWHWLQPYATTGSVPGNPVPQPVTLVPDRYGTVNLVYVNDMEGKTWELPAKTGINAWNSLGVGGSGAIFSTGTAAEPITTPLAIARLPLFATASTGVLKPFSQKLIALLGTDNSPDGFVNPDGQLHVMNVDPSSRPATGVAYSDMNLVLTPFPMTFAARRIAGTISVIGQTAYVATTSKTLSDPLLIDTAALGGVYAIDLGGITSSTITTSLPYFSTQGSYGGVSVYYEAGVGTHVIASQVDRQAHTVEVTTPANTPNPTLRVNTPQDGVLYRFTGWVRRILE